MDDDDKAFQFNDDDDDDSIVEIYFVTIVSTLEPAYADRYKGRVTRYRQYRYKLKFPNILPALKGSSF